MLDQPQIRAGTKPSEVDFGKRALNFAIYFNVAKNNLKLSSSGGTLLYINTIFVNFSNSIWFCQTLPTYYPYLRSSYEIFLPGIWFDLFLERQT